LRDAQPKMEQRGARLVVIGNGTPAMARDFRDEGRHDVAVYTDPGKRSYDLLGFKRGLLASLHPGTAAASVRAYKAGHRQIGIRGDPHQNGGVLVVDGAGTIRYRFASRHPGDHPAVDDVLAAL
jgi:hypothetical protein